MSSARLRTSVIVFQHVRTGRTSAEQGSSASAARHASSARTVGLCQTFLESSVIYVGMSNS